MQNKKDSKVYNIPVSTQLKGEFDVDVSEKVLEEIVPRHEALRNYFELTNGGLLQKVRNEVDFKIHFWGRTTKKIEELVQKFIKKLI